MGAMVQKQENLGELEQVVERCLDKRPRDNLDLSFRMRLFPLLGTQA